MSHVTYLESALDGTRLAAGQVHTVHQGRPIWVRYDLAAIRAVVNPEVIASRPPSLWRYRELLPLPPDAEPVTLGEGMSPLLPCPRLGRDLGLERLWVKDESQLPTGSFKSRGMTVAVSMTRYLGQRRLVVPTAGNAGGALAAYAARAGLEAFVFMPEDTPVINQLEAYLAGAHVFLVNGLITDCGRLIREATPTFGWFDMELAEQLGWSLPDVILYPTGGGTGLIGMAKAFAELRELGWLRGTKSPRFIACQSDGCAPIVRAFEAGERFAPPFAGAHTVASGLRVPAAVGDFMILDAVRASGGLAVAGREEQIGPWMRRAIGLEGISICPETAVCFAVLERLIADGRVRADEEVVVFNTGAAQKYPEAVPLRLPRLDKDTPLSIEILRAGPR
jgi:threonine synthase